MYSEECYLKIHLEVSTVLETTRDHTNSKLLQINKFKVYTHAKLPLTAMFIHLEIQEKAVIFIFSSI